MSRKSILKLFKKYVKGTDKGALVESGQEVVYAFGSKFKVLISTRSVKHTYDKRPAQEFEFLMDWVFLIIKYPDQIYRNKDGKRGSLCLVKTYKDNRYLCALERVGENFEVVTFFRVNEGYLDNYELLWEWRTAEPHRNAPNAFDYT